MQQHLQDVWIFCTNEDTLGTFKNYYPFIVYHKEVFAFSVLTTNKKNAVGTSGRVFTNIEVLSLIVFCKISEIASKLAGDVCTIRPLPCARRLLTGSPPAAYQRLSVLDAGADALRVQLSGLDLGQDRLGTLEESFFHALPSLGASLQENQVILLCKPE